MDSGSSSSMESRSSTTTSAPRAPRRLSAAAPEFHPSKASSSSTAAAPASLPAVASLPSSLTMPSGSSARSTTSFDPAGSSASAPAFYQRPGSTASAPVFYQRPGSTASAPALYPRPDGLLASAHAFYPTTASSSSSSTAVMPGVSARLPSLSPVPPEMLWLHPCREVKIEGARTDLLGHDLGLLAEQKRLIQKYIDLKEKAFAPEQRDQECFHSEDKTGPGSGARSAWGMQEELASEARSSWERRRKSLPEEALQDVNGEQHVGVLKLRIPGADESVASKNIAAHKEFSELPDSEIKFGSINFRDIPLQGRQAAVSLPNPNLDTRTSGINPARASSPEQ